MTRQLLLGLLLLAQGGFVPQLPKGVIAGRIMGVNGAPAANTRVAAIAMEIAGENAQTEILASITQTDGTGRYRMENIPPGRYRIIAGLIGSPTYFPGAATADGATAVVIGLDTIIVGADFALVRSPGVTVRGRVGMSGAGGANPLIRVVMTGPGVGSFDATLGPDGSFEFRRIPEGTYTVRVLPTSAGSAISTVVVGDKDVMDLQLTAPSVVSGRIEMEGDGALPAGAQAVALGGAPIGLAPTGIRVLSVQAKSTNGTIVSTVSVRADGFFILSVPDGEYTIALAGLPLDLYLKEMAYGASDLLKQPLRVSGAPGSDVRIKLTRTRPDSVPPGVKVSGRVTDIPAGTSSIYSITVIGSSADGRTADISMPLRPDGSFEVADFPRGSYAARVVGPNTEVATVPITVADKDIAGIEVPLILRAEVAGAVTLVDGQGLNVPRIPANVIVEFRPQPLPGTGAGVLTVPIEARPDGTFSTLVREGNSMISLSVPPGFTVTSIVAGSVDLRNVPLRLPKSGVRDIRIVLAESQRVRVGGRVVPVAGATSPVSVELTGRLGVGPFRASVKPDGTFEFPNVLSLENYTLTTTPTGSVTTNVVVGDRDVEGIPIMAGAGGLTPPQLLTANEVAAVNNLRAVNTAEETHRQSTAGYADIDALVAAGLLNAQFRAAISGYRISVWVDQRVGYSAVAIPINSEGRYGFHSRSDSVVRYSTGTETPVQFESTGVEVRGRVIVPNGANDIRPDVPSNVFVGFEALAPQRSFIGVQPDGGFTFLLPSGEHRISVVTLPGAAVTVRSAVSGATDLLREPLKIVGTAKPPEIEIVLEPAGAAPR